MFDLNGKVALVTGVSRGLGQAMAVALAGAGADIVGVGPRGLGDTEAMIEQAGRRAVELKADFAREDAAQVARDALAAFGRVDILVNNAGIIRLADAQDHSMEDYDAVMDVNLRAVFLLTRDIAQSMIAQGGGKIINICSVQSVKGGRGRRRLCGQQARPPRPHPGLGQRVGQIQHPGQRHRPGVHGHG